MSEPSKQNQINDKVKQNRKSLLLDIEKRITRKESKKLGLNEGDFLHQDPFRRSRKISRSPTRTQAQKLLPETSKQSPNRPSSTPPAPPNIDQKIYENIQELSFENTENNLENTKNPITSNNLDDTSTLETTQEEIQENLVKKISRTDGRRVTFSDSNTSIAEENLLQDTITSTNRSVIEENLLQDTIANNLNLLPPFKNHLTPSTQNINNSAAKNLNLSGFSPYENRNRSFITSNNYFEETISSQPPLFSATVNTSLNMTTPTMKPYRPPLNELAVRIPLFNGKKGTIDEFIREVKKIAKSVFKVDEKTFVPYVIDRIKGTLHDILSDQEFENLEDLYKALRSLDNSVVNYHKLYAELQELVQEDDEDINSYSHKLKCKGILIKEAFIREKEPTEQQLEEFVNELNEQQADIFLKNIDPLISASLNKKERNIERLQQEALRLEKQYLRRKLILNDKKKDQYHKVEDKSISKIYYGEHSMRQLYCQICRNPNHEALSCTLAGCVYCKSTQHSGSTCKITPRQQSFQCRFCGHLGHTQDTCKLLDRKGECCQLCQDLGHEISNCTKMRDFYVCSNCKETGHLMADCPKGQEGMHEKCENCGSMSHELNSCPTVYCRKCSLKGHDIKMCPFQNFRRGRICCICNKDDHEEEDCPTILVIKNMINPNQKNNTSSTNNYNRQNVVCQICNKPNHTADKCRSRYYQQSNPSYNNNGFNRTPTQNQNTNTNYQPNPNLNRNPTQNYQPRCQWCKQIGHTVHNCPNMLAIKNKTQPNVQYRKIDATCQYCKEKGHTADTCKKLIDMRVQAGEKICKYCKKDGHIFSDCEELKIKTRQQNPGN